MNLQDFTNSRLGILTALLIARLPEPLGRRMADWLAAQVARRRESALVRAIRLNQWVVGGLSASAEALDQAAQRVMQHAGRALYDFYHLFPFPKVLTRRLRLTPNARTLIERSQRWDGGGVVVGPHLSNFDLAMQAAGYHGIDVQVLSYADPTGGYRWQNRIRERAGLHMTPITPRALLQAVERLRKGGFVLTGVDRPVPGKLETLTFFGHPAPLPVGHVRLAMDAGAPVYVIACQMLEDGSYVLHASKPIPMQDYGNRKESIRRNAETVLEVLESYIRRAPEQWLMYYPVWPHLAAEVPQ